MVKTSQQTDFTIKNSFSLPVMDPYTQTQKSPVASSMKRNSFSSSMSCCSRGVSCSKDFHFCFNFEELKHPIQEISKMSQLILESIGWKLWGKKLTAFPKDEHEAYKLFDMSVDEFMKPRNKEQRLRSLIDDDKFQLDNVKKKEVAEKHLLVNGNMRANSSSVKVVSISRGDQVMGTQRPKMSFHIASIPKPQDVYKIVVNNVNQPFDHVWLPRSEDGSRVIHPLEKLSVLNFVDRNIRDINPVRPPPVECTSFKLVQEVTDLKELAAKLWDANEFAVLLTAAYSAFNVMVDLEHNQYRSFQGLTCLMQISTRTEDFIVDTLKLRVYIGPYLREIFKDPTKKKVMHGADKDILWLQRDFGIYVCNLFDTGQASRVLKMERNSLDYLLLYFCGVAANKEYQTADWRVRPLPDEMLRYAREDTHYLLHVFDLMKRRLVLSSKDSNCPEALLVEVYERSYNICMQLYHKDMFTEESYLHIYGLPAADLNGQQLAIVAGLCEWRDVVARAEDESTGYVLPNKILIEIAKHMPVTIEELRRLLIYRLPHMERNLWSIVSIIRHSMQNAYAFENIAKKLKLGNGNDGEEAPADQA